VHPYSEGHDVGEETVEKYLGIKSRAVRVVHRPQSTIDSDPQLELLWFKPPHATVRGQRVRTLKSRLEASNLRGVGRHGERSAFYPARIDVMFGDELPNLVHRRDEMLAQESRRRRSTSARDILKVQREESAAPPTVATTRAESRLTGLEDHHVEVRGENLGVECGPQSSETGPDDDDIGI
jgi:hypothetical protein